MNEIHSPINIPKVSEDYLRSTIAAYDASPEKYIANTENLIWTPEIEELISYAGLQQGDRVLDAGCAFGRDSQQFLDRGFTVTGIDRSDGLLKVAQERLADRATFFNMDMRYPEFEDNYFKAIWANAALLHLTEEDIRSTLREWCRILAPKGVLMASVKRGQGSKTFVEAKTSNDERFFTFLEIEGMKEMVNAAGLTPIDLRYENEQKRFPEAGRDMDWLISFSRKE